MNDQIIVITGASTGIGRAAAMRAARQGFHVLAGVRRAADVDALRSAAAATGGTIEPVLLDVCDPAAIENLRERVESDGRPLAALVNNAGTFVAGMVEVVSLDTWRQQFETNLFGLVAVTQALLPALRKSRGRVINISSIGGKSVMPACGVYQASKYAVEAFSDALRMETRSQGIKVAIIEPGAIKTPIFDKAMDAVDRQLAAMRPEHLELYAAQTRALAEGGKKMAKSAVDPDRVAKAILHAATAARPKTRYLVGPDARVLSAMKWLLPDRWFDSAVLRMMRAPKAAKASGPVSPAIRSSVVA